MHEAPICDRFPSGAPDILMQLLDGESLAGRPGPDGRLPLELKPRISTNDRISRSCRRNAGDPAQEAGSPERKAREAQCDDCGTQTILDLPDGADEDASYEPTED